MIPFYVGILILVAIFAVAYYIRTSSNKETISNKPNSSVKQRSNSEILGEDIVLALLTESGKTQIQGQYAILWNGVPGKKYDYVVTHNSLEIAKGSATSSSSVFKIRGLPLEYGKIYNVQVDTTKVTIPFTPPKILKVTPSNDELDVNTDIVPTNIEVIIGSAKVSLSDCQIRIDPPGFICKLPPGNVKPVMVIYNGPNAVNILM